MIKFICNVCGRILTVQNAVTLSIMKGFDVSEYKLCSVCADAIKKELDKGDEADDEID